MRKKAIIVLTVSWIFSLAVRSSRMYLPMKPPDTATGG